MPLPRSPACPLSRARPEANRPNRDRQPFRAARKVRRRVAESAAPLGSGRSARPTSVRVLMVFSRSRLDGVLPFFPVVQSAVLICRLWCVSLPYPQLDTNLMPKRGSALHHYQRQAFPEPYGYRAETHIEISAGVPTGGRIRQVTKTVSQGKLRVKKRKAPQTPFRVMGRSRNSPPPKTAPSQANRIRGHEEWLQRATGRWTGHHDGRSVFIGCPPDVGLVPQNHPLCRSDAEIGTFIAC